MAMLAQERQNCIIDMLKESGGIIKMSDIVKCFGVSNETARRDLETLQDQHIVKRIYGGAVLLDWKNTQKVSAPDVLPQASRERVAIGQAAANLVHNGETIILGAGTTVLQVAKFLKSHHSLTVVTNSLIIAAELCDADVEILILGGKLDKDERTIHGDMSIRAISNIFADKAIVGAGGVTLEYGVSDYSANDCYLRKEFLKHARQSILVTGSEKFGRNDFSIGYPLSAINTVITDSNLSPDYEHAIRDMGIELILTEP